jgi:hypothetical protein
MSPFRKFAARASGGCQVAGPEEDPATVLARSIRASVYG